MPLTYTRSLGVLERYKNNLAFVVRRKIFEMFMRECSPGPDSRVADFGVSGHQSHRAHYFFEELYPYRRNLTAIGRASEEAGWLPERFPGMRFLEADLRAIPLPDHYFDYGICNAVVEHAGPRDQQIALVREVCRVCRCVMFTTPNKGFPIELHVFLPFFHWLPDHVYRTVLRRIKQNYFADVSNLNLLDAKAFLRLFPRSRRNRMFRIGLPLMTTNLICISLQEPP